MIGAIWVVDQALDDKRAELLVDVDHLLGLDWVDPEVYLLAILDLVLVEL